MVENTQTAEPVTDTQPKDSEPQVDWEKRYKDAQSELTRTKQDYSRDKELLETITPFVNWDAASGKQVEPEDDGLVSKSELNRVRKELQQALEVQKYTADFRTKYPDMIEYEPLVDMYLGKTDPRRKPEERIAKAVELARNLVENERKKGMTAAEKAKEEKKAKEAGASGLSEAKGSKAQEPEGETYEQYVNFRKALRNKNMGLMIQE